MSEEPKKAEARHVEPFLIAKRIIGFFILVLIILVQVNIMQQRKDADFSVEYNARQVERFLNYYWIPNHYGTVVPAETVVGKKGATADETEEVSTGNMDLWADAGNTLILKPGKLVGSYTICGYSEGGNNASSSKRAFVLHSTDNAAVIDFGVPCP